MPTPFAIPARDATIASSDGACRYLTVRAIDGAPEGDGRVRDDQERDGPEGRGRACVFILLRPEREEIGRNAKRCVETAKKLGFSRVVLAYAFAHLADDMADLAAEGDPVGPDSDAWLTAAFAEALESAGEVVCALGSGGSYMERDQAVLRLLSDAGVEPKCLGTDRNGFPSAPARFGQALAPYAGRPDIF